MSPRNSLRHSSHPKPLRSARLQVELLEERTVPSVNMVEAEPNNTTAAAQSLPRVLGTNVIVAGDVSSPGDRDWFRVDLHAGDVIGAALSGQSGLNPAMRLVDASRQLLILNDDSFFTGGQLLPPESPLPYDESHVQNSEAYYVIATPGTYLIEVAASGDASAGKFKLDLVVARPGLEKEPIGTRQILFLDFDGAMVNFSQFAGDKVTGTKRLAPLSSFLTDWGLSPADENVVIDGVMAKVTAKLSAYVRSNGLNGDFALTGIPGQFDIEIRSSRDHPDDFGKNRFVSRVVVGGTEAQVGHAGLAQYIDVGNFKTDDEAVATLDRFTRGLARIPIQPPATPIDFLTEGIATLVAHEAGHLFGSFHTDQLLTDIFAGTPNLMDPNFTAHVGPDNIFGTADDVDLQFGVDSYRLTEPFRGLNDTLNTVSFGLSTGKHVPAGASSASYVDVGGSRLMGPRGPVAGSAGFTAAALDGEAATAAGMGLSGDSFSFGSVTQDPAELSADWPSFGHDWSNTGYNAAERAISATTVANLVVIWQHGPTSVVGTPIISEGVVYLADSFGVVYAKNAATGAPIWTNDVSDAADPLFGASFQAAPVVTQDAVFVADSDAFVYRLDRRTGALEWKTRVDDNPNALIQSDPIVFEGQVLVGVASHENEEPGAEPTDNFTLRGSIVALDANTGAIVWKTFTTSDQTLEHPKFGAGVGVWSSPAIDPHTDRLFIGTGNYYEPGSDNPSPASRRDKDYSDSLVALSTKNGKIKDHRQFTANDVWGHAFPDGPDFDVGAPPNLFSIPSGHGHKMRDVVGVGDKEGTYYVMDRDTLDVIWSRKISDGGLIGGIQSTAAIGNGVVYVASHELFDGSSIDSVIPRDQAAVWLNSPEGGFILQNLCKTNVYALDAATGTTLWSREIQGGATFAPLILTNGASDGVTDDVLFMADAGGRLRALDAANGGADLFAGPGFIQLTLPFPNPDDPGGPPIQVGQFITAISVAHGRLYVSHGIPVEGLNPGGVTVFVLPSLAGSDTPADGDHESRINISDVAKKEGKKNQTTLFTFTVTLSAAYDQAVTMSFRTVNDTATSSSGDYVAKTGTLTFAPGKTTKTITIEGKGDSNKEANETFYLDLFGNSSNSLFTKNRGLGTILNDD